MQIKEDMLDQHVIKYRIAGKVGGKKIWRIVPELNIGGFYFGDYLQEHNNYIHNL